MIKNLPQGWRVEKLDDIVFFQEGPGVRNTQFRNQGVKLLNVGNINDNKINLDATKIYISEEEAYGKYSHFLVDDGDLLIACSGIVVENFHKKISFISKKDLPLCLNTSTMRFKTLNEQKLNINFYKYFLMSDIFKHQLQKLITGSAQLNFGPSHIKKMFAPLPPFPQQEKIVKVLDNSSLLVEQQKQLIEKYDVFLKSKFIEMFGDPITNPMGWKIEKFDNIFTKITDGTHNSPPMSKRGYKYITAKHIKENKIDFERDATYISEEEHKKIFARCSPEKGDILYIKDGATTGIACINTLEEEISLLSSVALLKPSVKIKSEYIVSYLNNPTVKLDILQNMVGGAIKRLTIQKIKNLTIPLPPIELQNKFASIVEKIEVIKEKETQKLNHLETLHVSLMDKAFKGEIV